MALGGMLGGSAADIMVRIKADDSQYQAALGKTSTSTSNFVSKIKGMGPAIAASLAVAGAAYVAHATKVAMTYESMEKGFEKLLANQGVQAEQFMQKLKDVSKGTMSEIQLMQQANQAMLLDIDLDTFTQAVETAMTVAASTGQDVNFLVESLVNGIGRMSNKWLDNLGIIVDTEKAYADYAATLGKTAEQLTEAERKAAFMAATTEAMAARTAELGDVSGTAALQWQQMQASISDVTAEIGSAFLPVLQEVLDAIKSFSQAGGFEVIAGGASITGMALMWLINVLKQTYAGFKMLDEALRGNMDEAKMWFNMMETHSENATQNLIDMKDTTIELVGGVGELANELSRTGGAMESVGNSTDGSSNSMRIFTAAAQSAGAGAGYVGEQAGSAAGQMRVLEVNTERVTAALSRLAKSYGISTEAIKTYTAAEIISLREKQKATMERMGLDAQTSMTDAMNIAFRQQEREKAKELAEKSAEEQAYQKRVETGFAAVLEMGGVSAIEEYGKTLTPTGFITDAEKARRQAEYDRRVAEIASYRTVTKGMKEDIAKDVGLTGLYGVDVAGQSQVWYGSRSKWEEAKDMNQYLADIKGRFEEIERIAKETAEEQKRQSMISEYATKVASQYNTVNVNVNTGDVTNTGDLDAIVAQITDEIKKAVSAGGV